VTASATSVRVLWASSARDGVPRFVTAWPAALVTFAPWEYGHRRDVAERHHRADQDPAVGPWTYWTTDERLELPAVPEVVAA
jgi:hypothetical protein